MKTSSPVSSQLSSPEDAKGPLAVQDVEDHYHQPTGLPPKPKLKANVGNVPVVKEPGYENVAFLARQQSPTSSNGDQVDPGYSAIGQPSVKSNTSGSPEPDLTASGHYAVSTGKNPDVAHYSAVKKQNSSIHYMKLDLPPPGDRPVSMVTSPQEKTHYAKIVPEEHLDGFRRTSASSYNSSQWGTDNGGLFALRHSSQTSMEAILACHPALFTEWLGWVAISCELWCNCIGPVIAQFLENWPLWFAHKFWGICCTSFCNIPRGLLTEKNLCLNGNSWLFLS